ncbi:hypothetical protein [Neoaquamicrobium sediminum]|uniref:DUF2383 domain-containing protein n=1 Tax=Neoaquamicrobium sediminum TaxID=1849104 RepID=A0ABV3WSN3_9HYPH
MARKPTRLRNLRIKEISLCENGMNQHAEIVLHKAADPAPEYPSASEMAKALHGASPEVLEIVKGQIAAHEQLLADFKKMNDEGNYDMNAIEPDHHYKQLVREHMEKADMTFENAAVDLQNRRPDKVALAYQKDEAAYVQRQVDRRDRTNV